MASINIMNGERVVRTIYLTICDVYDGDPTIDLKNRDVQQWCNDAKTAIHFMTEDGTLRSTDLLDLAYYLVNGDEYMMADMLTDGGIHNYLGGRLYAMHTGDA